MECRDPWIGNLIKDLIDSSKANLSLSLILKKHDQILIETDTFFYFKLATQY